MKKFSQYFLKTFLLPTTKKLSHHAKYRSLAGASIALSYAFLLLVLFTYLTIWGDPSAKTGSILFSIGLQLLCYALLRRGYHVLGGALISICIVATVVMAIQQHANHPKADLVALTTMPFLAVALSISAIVGHWRQLIATLILIIATIFYTFTKITVLQNSMVLAIVIALLTLTIVNILVLIVRDFDIKYMEDQRLRSAYRSRLSSLAEMSSGISHEVNNPLTIIEGFANQIVNHAKKTPGDNSRFIYLAEKIVENSERISRIIRALRSFAREGDKEPFTKVTVEKLVTDTLDFCRARFKNHGIELSCTPIPAHLVIDGRPVQIAQILLNVLYNSFDALRNINEKWVKVEVFESFNSIEISIMDSGKGIALEVQEKMFQPFFTTKDIGDGAGLGLSICSSLVKEHHGEIFLDSSCPNTRFVIRLPKVQAKELPIAA